MKKFRNVSAIVTLLAGFISSVVMILQKYELVDFLWILVLVMTCFYIVSRIVCLVLNRVFKDEEPEEEENADQSEEAGEDGENPEEVTESVSQEAGLG